MVMADDKEYGCVTLVLNDVDLLHPRRTYRRRHQPTNVNVRSGMMSTYTSRDVQRVKIGIIIHFRTLVTCKKKWRVRAHQAWRGCKAWLFLAVLVERESLFR